MTNKEFLFNNDRELAKALIKVVTEEDWEYNYDDELEYRGLSEELETPDGESFGCYGYSDSDMEDAIEWTLRWLYSLVDKEVE